MLTIEEIGKHAALLKWKRQFGPFEKCPVCYGLLHSCELCRGHGKVIQEDIDAWNNPIAKMRREVNHGRVTRRWAGDNYSIAFP